ncbi:hypothetical protein BC937DRAFT_92550 [Endogone sp. FLAS-F59071]|nr:hypothetical protein BC937DRAFT_92550 [Endogone sp. FLAS-F59071]|eukprot:RUS15358.1 hypothetical protein BC937DRAFT_92550 [Endogone sp. FLAS-F59071]
MGLMLPSTLYYYRTLVLYPDVPDGHVYPIIILSPTLSSSYNATTPPTPTKRNMEELLTCPVCLELAKVPRETICCNQLFCLECARPLQRCPVCRAERFSIRENKLVARILDSLPIACPFECGASVTRGNLEDHIATCEQRMFDCRVSTCEQISHKGQALYLQHMVDQHPDLVEEVLTQFFDNREKEKKKAESSLTIEPEIGGFSALSIGSRDIYDAWAGYYLDEDAEISQRRSSLPSDNNRGRRARPYRRGHGCDD